MCQWKKESSCLIPYLKPTNASAAASAWTHVPQGVLEIAGGVVVIENEDACVACGDCVEECPMGCITEIVED